MTIEAVAEASGKSVRSLTPMLTRLVDAGMVALRGKNYRVLKSGKGAWVSSGTVEDLDKTISGITVSQLDGLKPKSITHMADLMVGASKLPPDALMKLREALNKHDDVVGVDVEKMGSTIRSHYGNADDNGRVVPAEPWCYLECFILTTKIMKEGAFGSGRLFVYSQNYMTKAFNALNYNTAINFVGDALKLTNSMTEANGMLSGERLFVASGWLGNIMVKQGRTNPSIYIDQAIEVNDPDELTMKWRATTWD